jgi:hypothetical protein
LEADFEESGWRFSMIFDMGVAFLKKEDYRSHWEIKE